MIIDFIHCHTDTLRTGSLLFLVGLRARWMRIHSAVWHRINRHFARRLRQRTAYFRLLHGRAADALPDTCKGAAEDRFRRSALPIR
ncbi:MAG: hypothetical protein Q7U92_12265, partial [Bradyrhizobium sp.]|nr:hypothetical protein [Bradyrhizobium sp.]